MLKKILGSTCLMAAICGAMPFSDPTLELLSGHLREAFTSAGVAPEFHEDGPHAMSVRHAVQTYTLHTIKKNGEVSKETHIEEGPSHVGFLLRAEIEPMNSPHAPYTPQTIRRPYWDTYLQITPLAGTDMQVFWSLSYGASTDQTLVERIKALMEEKE